MIRPRHIVILSILGLLIGGVLLPMAVNAQVTLLEPIPGYIASQETTDLGSYLSGVFQLAIGIASGLAVIMIVFGGIQYMTTDSVTGKSDGLQKVESAVFGLVVALVAFLVLQTINPALVQFDIVSTLQRVSGELGDRVEERSDFEIIEDVIGEPWPDDSPIRNQLESAGIHINNPNCTSIGQENCTSLYGLGSPSRLISLMERCKAASGGTCLVMVTAGTEFWLHSTNTQHRPGSAVVDLRSTVNLNKYITDGSAVPNLECFQNIVKDGVTFQWEGAGCQGSTGPHWHVVY